MAELDAEADEVLAPVDVVSAIAGVRALVTGSVVLEVSIAASVVMAEEGSVDEPSVQATNAIATATAKLVGVIGGIVASLASGTS